MIVSIIVPYFNEDEPLSIFLKSISDNFRKEFSYELEIILVNNGGKLYSGFVPKDINIVYKDECVNLNSPYSARNRGIETCRGDYVVFIDATCEPDTNWCSRLNDIVHSKPKTISVANVKYHSSSSDDIGHIYDSIINVDNEKTVADSNCAKTACIGMHRDVLDHVGLFTENLRSGGDVEWTKKAVKTGYDLVFEPGWIVLKIPRNMIDLSKKQFRVAKGWPRIWRKDGIFLSSIVKKVLLCFIPPNPKALFSAAKRRDVSLTLPKKIKLMLFGTYLRITSACGVVYAIAKRNT